MSNLIPIVFIGISFAGAASLPLMQDRGSISLLKGNDLSAWTVKMGGEEPGEDRNGAFSLKDGVLRVYPEAKSTPGRIGHLFYKKPYSHFRLRFRYRFTGKKFGAGHRWPEQYGGVVFHAQAPERMGLEQEYPVCMEFQLLGGRNSGKRSTGNVCTIGTQVVTGDTLNPVHCINSASPTYDGDQWIEAEMEVWGDSLVRHRIEGVTVLEYSRLRIGGGFVSESFDWVKGNVKDWETWERKKGTPLKGGYIGIQAHDAIEFKEMELLKLTKN